MMKSRVIMVGRRGEAPRVPPYFKKAMALSAGRPRLIEQRLQISHS